MRPEPYGPPPPRTGRRVAILLSIGGLVLIGALVAVVVPKVTADPGDAVPQPHRVAAPRPHWVALSKAWSDDRDSGGTGGTAEHGLVSDGKRAVTLVDRPSRGADRPAALTGYDGATGTTLWHTALSWAQGADPVGGDGVVIVPSGPESAISPGEPEPLDYVALDTATGKVRWRAHATARTFDSTPDSEASRPAAGALLNGVFYYADGTDVIGVDAATGRVRHRYTGRTDVGLAGPVVAGGRLALLTAPRSEYGGGTDDTYAVHVFEPDLKRHATVPLRTGGDGGPERIAASGAVVVLWTSAYGDLWTVDARTRRALVHTRLPTLGGVGGLIGRTALVVDHRAATARLTGYDLRTGERSWSADPFPGGIGSFQVEVADGTVLAIGDGVTIVDPARGRRVFHRATGGAYSEGRAVPAGGRLVIDYDRGVAGYR